VSVPNAPKILSGLLGPLVLLVVLPAPANAYPRPGITERVSVASDGAEADAPSFYRAAIGADGRHVAFASGASNLVPGDGNGAQDAFLRDRATGITERVSVASDGAEADESSFSPAVSADGRYVAFQSFASNLVPGDTNWTYDVFVRDRATGKTERVSVASDGAEANGEAAIPSTSSFAPAISGDGRYVAFSSQAFDLVPGDTNFFRDVFVHDRATGTTERVSTASDGAEANSSSGTPVISADARYVAFPSGASNLVPGDGNGAWDVFVHDRATGTTQRVSTASDGAEANGGSSISAISADGRHVAFESPASNLVPGDTNGAWDVFVHDRATGTTGRVSTASDGVQANDASYAPAISADGRHVAFWSAASNLVPGDTNGGNGGYDVFVHDRAVGTTDRVSVASDGAEGNISSYTPAISADGRHVAFESYASNLVPADTNELQDAFVHDRGDSLGVMGTPSVLKVAGGVGVSGRASFSGATLAEATDPDEDGTGVGPLEPADAGAELTGAALIYRPEQEDLLLRLDLSSLPSDPAGAGLPGILYGADLRVGETRYEVRALRAGGTAVPPAAPYAALYRCDDLACTEHAALTGSFGTTGEQVLVSMPLSALGVAEGTELTGLRAFTAAGEATPGALLALDEVSLPSSAIPDSRVELGIAPVSTPAAGVAFAVAIAPITGEFSGTIPTEGLSPGSHRVWVRACLGDACGPATFTEVGL
jgi:Tol biopolymer transport system component